MMINILNFLNFFKRINPFRTYILGGGISIINNKYSSTVFACVDAIISRSIQAKPKLINYTNKGEAKRIYDHPLLRVLKRPNKQQTWRDLMTWTVGFRETKGNVYWWLIPSLNNKNIVGIRILDPERIAVSENENGQVIGYVYTSISGQQIPFEADEIISFPYFNPDSQISGIGPLQASKLATENDQLAQSWINKLFKNGATPSGILQTEQKLNPESFKRVSDSWKEKYQGESNMAKTAVLDAGLKYQRLSLSQADLSFYEGRKDAREEIMMVFRVPKAALGMSEGVNRASAEATLYAFAELKIQPTVESIFDRINEFILPKFRLNPSSTQLEFNSLVPKNRELELKEQTELLKNKAITINEVRSRRGLADVWWGNEPYPEKSNEITIKKEEEKRNQQKNNYQRKEKGKENIVFNHELYKSKIDRISIAIAKNLQPQVRNSYDRTQKEIIKYLNETGKNRGIFGDLNPIKNKIINILIKPITKILTTSYYRSGKLTIKYLDSQKENLKIENNEAIEWISKHALEDATSITQTLKNSVTPLITQAIKEGLSTYQLTQNLKTHFSKMADWKVKQIAHTEVHKALSAAAHITAESTKRKLYKCWSDSGDDRVCEECRNNSNQGFIPMNQCYSSGAMHPEDSHPECRCREFYEPASRHKRKHV